MDTPLRVTLVHASPIVCSSSAPLLSGFSLALALLSPHYRLDSLWSWHVPITRRSTQAAVVLAPPIRHHSTPYANAPPSGPVPTPQPHSALRTPHRSTVHLYMYSKLRFKLSRSAPHLSCCPTTVSILHPALGSSRAPTFVSLSRPVSHPTSLDIVPLPSLALALGSARCSTRQTLTARGAKVCLIPCFSLICVPPRRLKPESIRRRALGRGWTWSLTASVRTGEQIDMPWERLERWSFLAVETEFVPRHLLCL
ncbi:hypothetical protein B0H13DRAFT_2377571 [Mycena leptocephala]|nr:hypothetical protein B0H13DRAFT_2377571 [Mycena leptocephala]